jgi:predicted phosphodiesterase
MLIQYTSDIHLEFRTLDQIPKLFKNINADVLVLAGDICAINTPEDYEKFIAMLKYYTPKYKHVLHVAGNHEAYCTGMPTTNNCMDAVNRKLKSLSKTYPNYIYLNCDTITLTINKKPYMFIGATLWTKVYFKDREEVQTRMNDYECIYLHKDKKVVKFTVADMQKLHSRHALFIKKAIAESVKTKIPAVLITHHKPVGDTTAEKKNILTQAYESDITSIIVAPVKVCIYGHTHVHYDKVINGVRYLSNPIGYPGQHTLYKNDLGVEV